VSFAHDGLEELLAVPLRPAVSILLPVSLSGPDVRQGPIRLKNLVRAAEDRLQTAGLQADDAARVVAPAVALQDDRGFWRRQEGGLALYAAPNFFRWHTVARPVRELCTVGDRFHVTQLLPVLAMDRPFYVLAISQKDVRLIEATRTTAHEIDLGDLPRTLSDALQYDTPAPGRAPQMRTIYDRKEEIRQFCHVIDRGLQPFLAHRGEPLVLAAVDFLFPLYREANTFARLLPDVIPGNPEGLSAQDLGARGWDVLRPHLDAAVAAAAASVQELVGLGRASVDLATVVRAAHEGRVSELLVADGDERWGRFEPATGVVTTFDRQGPTGEDLANLAAVQALERRAVVHVIDRAKIPGAAGAAAIFRY
jgi:Bacterial archaeo-eukaryotic release factor family 3